MLQVNPYAPGASSPTCQRLILFNRYTTSVKLNLEGQRSVTLKGVEMCNFTAQTLHANAGLPLGL